MYDQLNPAYDRRETVWHGRHAGRGIEHARSALTGSPLSVTTDRPAAMLTPRVRWVGVPAVARDMAGMPEPANDVAAACHGRELESRWRAFARATGTVTRETAE